MLSTIFLSLLSLTFTTALPTDSNLDKRQSTGSGPFTLIAAHSGSPIHLQAINANGGSFWIGKPPLTYCPIPPVPPGDCPPGTETALNVEDGNCGLATEVPGGQDVYVAYSGALSFTEPHEEGGEVGATTGFVYQNNTNTTGGLGVFSFTGLGSVGGFVACPTVNGTGPYQIFADLPYLCDKAVPGGNVSACIGFDALGDKFANETAAFEYE